MPVVNTHSLNSSCSGVLDATPLSVVNFKASKCSQAERCYVWYRTLMDYWPSIIERQYQNLIFEFDFFLMTTSQCCHVWSCSFMLANLQSTHEAPSKMECQPVFFFKGLCGYEWINIHYHHRGRQLKGQGKHLHISKQKLSKV